MFFKLMFLIDLICFQYKKQVNEVWLQEIDLYFEK